MTTASPAVVSPAATALRTDETSPRRMDPMRKIALAGGVLYLITFAASIPQLKTFKHIIDDPSGYISTPGSNAAVLWGSLLEIITAAAGIGTAIVLYPVTRRVSRTSAIGFVTSRVVESMMILVGVLSLLSVLTLKAHYAGATGAQADSLRVTGDALVSIRQWTFLLGPGLIAGINALFLGYVMYRGRLVPRIIPTIGLIGAPIIITSAIVTLFGGWAQTSGIAFLFGLLDVIWEFSLGVYLTFKGFKRVPAITV
ncbi:MAG TPA: DUF4386 domain-containing protein [Frankiaceae bacterium]|nr:DUF4386 domain-containing protein [Frankiaceae bacterium]